MHLLIVLLRLTKCSYLYYFCFILWFLFEIIKKIKSFYGSGGSVDPVWLELLILGGFPLLGFVVILPFFCFVFVYGVCQLFAIVINSVP